MSRRLVGLIALILIVACSSTSTGRHSSASPTGRWERLRAQWESIEAIRASNPVPESNRRRQIEALVKRQRRLEPIYVSFITELRRYVEETSDQRAASMYARERMLMGDEYADYLARYDRAIEMYRNALEVDPENRALREKIAAARERQFVSQSKFHRVQPGMDEETIAELIGYPRVDWVRETVRNGRTYSVWIYPREDGGAAAVYFDDGVVYYKNWDAAEATGS